MSFFLSKKHKAKPQYTGLQTQTSTGNLPIPIVWGMNRVAPNIIWQNDFTAHKEKVKSGKGGSSSSTFTYSASFELGLCWGLIAGIGRAWKDQSKETSYTAMGWTLFPGTTPQSPWGYLVTAHPTEALGYPGIALLAAANYGLGDNNTLGQHSFEIQGGLYNTQVGGTGDADPAQVVDDFLNNDRYGVIINSDIIDQDSLFSGPLASTTGDGAFQTYCRAIGFGLSPALVSQEAANSILYGWCTLCNTAVVYTGYSLKFVPYTTEVISGNGVVYNPDLTVAYTLTDNEFIVDDKEDPITFSRVDPADAYNSVTITIKNRNNEYNDLPVEWRDQGLVDQYTLRADNPTDAPDVCEPDMAAKMVALMGQRIAYIRNSFTFKLPDCYCLVEPMDILECVDARFGVFLVRVKEVVENDDDTLTFTAEEYADGAVSNLGDPVTQDPSNNPVNTGVTASDVNTPIFIQPPPSLTGGQPQIWVAVSGGNPIDVTADPLWGGCQVWIATDGTGTTYNMIGTIDAPARMGKLTAALAAYGSANPDTVDTLKVNFAMSDAVFDDTATASDAAAGVTIGYIKPEGAHVEEFISYETPTLNTADTYWFTGLFRGLNGSVPGAHALGASYARLDTEAIFKYNFPLDLIGDTIFVKLVSFNVWGNGLQDISTVTPYSFTISSAYTYGTDLADLGDVDLSTPPTSGQNLEWDATLGKWVAVSPLYGFSWLRVPVATKILAVFDSPTSWKLPTGLTNSQGTIIDSDTATAAAPSAQTDFDIQSPLGSSIGTMRFATGSLTATFINASPDSITLGTPVYIISPANLNGITGAITGSIRGTRP